MEIVEMIVKIYLFNIFSVCIHELSHFIVGKILFKNIKQIVIGNEKICFTCGKLKISPIVFGGYVDLCDGYMYSKTKLVIFYLAGVVANFFVLVLVAIFVKGFYKRFFITYSIIMIIANIIPMNGNDMGCIVDLLSDYSNEE